MTTALLIASGGKYRVDLPYAVPTSAPYNVPQPVNTPTPDATGSAVHPDVIDFGPIGWNGWRFWMAMTPYANSYDKLENPSILVSQDGVNWRPPSGLVNPIYPAPPTGWNSDTDLTYDPVKGELVLVYRGPDFHPLVARSKNGVTWPTVAARANWPGPGEEAASPALVRIPDGEWVMYAVGYPSRRVLRWAALSPEGPWLGPLVCSGIPTTIWHIDVIYHAGKWWMLCADGRETETNSPMYAASSKDGISWNRNTTPIMSEGSGGWDSLQLYRGSLQPAGDESHMRVWYPGKSSTSTWRIGQTLVPVSEWP